LKRAAARILLVYGYEPSGHAAAALALEEAARARGLLVSRVEVSGDHHPAAALAVARGYHALLRAAPGVWGALYRSAAARAALSATRAAYLSLGGARRLLDGVRRRGAGVVVCPQASVAAVFAAARRRGELDVPVVSVLTDYGVHPFWADPPADLILAPSAAAAAELEAAGVPAARLRATGIPIHPAFAAPPSRAAARGALALPASAPVALLSGGSHGHGDLDRAAAALLDASPRVRVLALCGRNERLRRALSRRAGSGDRLRVFGPQPPALVAAMLAASDVHLGKPGGLTAAESLAVGVPMVLSRALPGQEEANARHLLAAGAAVDGGPEPEAARVVAALLSEPRRLSGLREAATSCAAPGAADAALRAIAELLAAPAATGRSRSAA
jgi:processive 1,2-diacylglycerol beta-glucosyltransferase